MQTKKISLSFVSPPPQQLNVITPNCIAMGYFVLKDGLGLDVSCQKYNFIFIRPQELIRWKRSKLIRPTLM